MNSTIRYIHINIYVYTYIYMYNIYKIFSLPDDIRHSEVEDKFSNFGKIISLNVKVTKSGAPFAFVEYEDSRDAEDAIRDMDGRDWLGRKLRVEVISNNIYIYIYHLYIFVGIFCVYNLICIDK
eukprot:GHVL01011816.1.p1 GENE.GHVL01011816.1~~GHVL01011816.1.p1  ORF type:complete len:124 (+),score=31.07 GHVL01011816.1:459-830(+)